MRRESTRVGRAIVYSGETDWGCVDGDAKSAADEVATRTGATETKKVTTTTASRWIQLGCDIASEWE